MAKNKITTKSNISKTQKKRDVSNTNIRITSIVELSSLNISNFKPFGDGMTTNNYGEREVALHKFAPLTLIYGKNSSGKSSIIQSLNLLAQSSEKRLGLRQLNGRGRLSNLGSFPAYVHQHKTHEDKANKKPVRMTYSFTLNEERGLNKKKQENKCYGYQLGYQIDKTKRGEIKYVNYFDDFIHDKKNPEEGLSFLYSKRINKHNEEEFSFHTDPEFYENPTGKKLLEHILSSSFYISSKKKVKLKLTKDVVIQILKYFSVDYSSLGLPYHLESVFFVDKDPKKQKEFDKIIKHKDFFYHISLEMADYLKKFNLSFLNFLRRYRYVGPARDLPKRTQTYEGSSSDVGISGSKATDILAENKNAILETMNNALKKLEINYTIKIDGKIDDIIDSTYSVTLTDNSTKTKVSTFDVGFGIWQFIPIIVQGLYPMRNIISCEQPEIHLHPALIANLADFFIETSNLKIDNRIFELNDEHIKDGRYIYGNQWIIESHSELLIYRVLRRIKEGKIKPSDVKVLYVEPASTEVSQSSIKELRIDKDGEFIDRWPDGFFDEIVHEMS